MPDVICLGEALIDFVADESGVTLIECPGFRKAAGGAVANVAVGLARLGVSTAFLGKVGDDPFGHFLEQTFSASGVDTRYMSFDQEARTGLAFVSLQANGERDFVFFRNPSADMLYRAEEVPDAALEGCRLYHFGSITLIQEPSRGATLDALRRARERGALISYDPNLRAPLWPDLETARREILAALPLADIVKVSDEEGVFLYGTHSAEATAQRVLSAGPRLAVVTLGAVGAYLATASGGVSVAGYAVEAVDTTGAGDGFVAGLLSGILERDGVLPDDPAELERLGRFGNAVGALTCTQRGAIPALPTRAAAEAFLRSA
jgi:fructokinase